MRKMKRKKLSGARRRILTAMILAGLSALPFAAASSVAGAAEADWQTEEYFASRGLDIVNAAAAYDLGFTGKGVRFGVCDQPTNFGHPDFSGKSGSSMLNTAKFSNILGYAPFYTVEEFGWQYVTHGTHVSGIAAADKNDAGIHGVAFDADVLGAVYGEYIDRYNSFRVDPGYSTFAPYLSLDDVKVINNSWSSRRYLNDYSSLDAYRYTVAGDIMDSVFEATKAGKLLVFAAGNHGRPEANPQALSAALYDEAKNQVVAVTALDDVDFLSRSGGKISGSQLMGIFSNFALYAEDYAMAAPGTNILSANANFAADGMRDISMSGTSMATPFVAGGAALVQQAFPYLDAKQIGDVLLSTANADVSATSGYVVSYQNRDKVNIFYTDPSVTSKTDAELRQDIKALLDTRDTSAYPFNYLQAAYDRNCTVVPYYQVPMEALVGQGVLDIGQAVHGLAALNARRLSASDISGDYTVLGTKTDQALYTVDTAGYDSEWSNDIREIRVGYLSDSDTEEDLKARYNYYKVNWLDNPSGQVEGAGAMQDYIKEFNDNVEKSGLAGLHVGLLKTGEGSLALSGTNTYQGASIAAGGTLFINGSVAGDAYSVKSGVLRGSGVIGGTLYNGNEAIAGDATGKGDLRAANLVSDGLLMSVIYDNGNGNTKFIVDGTADVEGSTIEVDDILPGEKFTVLTAGKVTGIPKNNGNTPVTGMLNEELTVGDKEVTVSVTAANNLGTSDERINETYDAMVYMHKILDRANDPREEEMRPLFDLEAPEAREALSSISSGAAAKSASLAQTSAMTGHIVSSRLTEAFVTKPMDVKIPAAQLDDGEEKAVALPMKLPQPAENDFWFKAAKNWGDLKGGAYYHGTAFAVGYDRAYGKAWRAGAFVSHGTVGFADTGARNEMKDTRLGLYGGYRLGPHAGYVYLDYGWLKNDLTRSIAHLGLSPKADYDSRILELGGEYKYDLQAGKDTPWHLSPYANMQLSGLWQDGYTERNAGVYGQRVSSAANTYFAGGLGLECKRYLANGSYALRLGVKHAFTGADPKLTFGYVGDNASKYEMRNEQDKTHFVMSLGGEAEFAPGWWLAGDAALQKGTHDRDVMCALTLRRMW